MRKTKFMKRIFKFFIILTIIRIISCTNDISGGSNQTDNAKIHISLNYESGKPVEKATLSIGTKEQIFDTISQNFNKIQISDNSIIEVKLNFDSTYIFEIRDDSGNASVTEINAKSLSETLNNITAILFPPGKISGSVQSDGLEGLVYVKGTVNYTSVDSKGVFTIPNLAPGIYSLCYISSENLYAKQETDSVIVVSGNTTTATFPQLWNHSGTIIINTASSGANISENLSNYPLLITLDSSNFNFSETQINGDDLRFFKNNQRLKHETAYFSSEEMKASIWVLIPTIYGNDSTQSISFMWGNSEAIYQNNLKGVFDSSNGFRGVWHFDKDFNDASSYNHPYNIYGEINLIKSEAIIKGIHLSNKNTYLRIDSNDCFDITGDITLSAWVKADSLSTYTWNDAIISKGSNCYSLSRATGKDVFAIHTMQEGQTNSKYADGFTQLNDLKLHFITGVKRKDSLHIYTDGIKEGSIYAPDNTALSSHPLIIGAKDTSTAIIDIFHGTIDEVRIGATARSDNWIKFNYETQKPNQKTVSFN